MSVGSVSSVVSAASMDSSASVLTAKKALDVQRQQGEDLVRLMESSMVEGPKGQNLDIMV